MRLQEAKRQLKNHLLSEVADEVNARITPEILRKLVEGLR